MIPWDYTRHTYENYLKLQPGIYPYKVYFYEGEPVEIGGKAYDLSCKDVFPVAVAENRDEFCEKVVQYAMGLFNSLGLGVTFEYLGHDIVDTYKTEFRVNNINSIVYYNGFPYGGLGGFFPNKKEFGVAMHIGKEKEYNRYLGELVHEMLHCLGLGHKFTTKTIFTGKQVSEWIIEKDLIALDGELPRISDDSTHGVDVIYETDVKFKVSGYIRNSEKFEHTEAFIVGWSKLLHNRKLLYQTTIDANGYYEFSLRHKNGLEKGFKILCVGKNGDSYYWNDLSRQPVDRFKFWRRHTRYRNVHLNLFTEDSGIILSTLSVVK